MILLILVECLLLLLAGLAEAASGRRAKVMDEVSSELDVAKLAKYFCWNNNDLEKQISRLDSIDKLVDYLEDLPVEHEFSSCADKKLVILKHLQVMLQSGNDNVCGNQKLTLIEFFHHKYITNRKSSTVPEVPTIIKSFFLNYASFIAELCTVNNNDFFNSIKMELDQFENPELDGLLQEFADSINVKSRISSYNDMYLVWGLVEGLSKNVRNQFKEMQSVCVNSMRPIYSQTLLPVMRLIDLGYYPVDRSFINVINNNPSVSRVYKIMLLCETFMPIRMIKGDQSQPSDQIQLVKPKELSEDELESLSLGELMDDVEFNPVTWEGDSIPNVTADEAKTRVMTIMTNLKSRKSSLLRVAKFIIKSMKGGFKSPILSETKERFTDVADEVVSSVDVENLTSDESDLTTTRHKRSLKEIGFGIAVGITNIIGYTIVMILACLLLSIRFILTFMKKTGLFYALWWIGHKFRTMFETVMPHLRAQWFTGRGLREKKVWPQQTSTTEAPVNILDEKNPVEKKNLDE